MDENPFHSTEYKILILEDQEPDALLMVRELRKAGFVFHWKRVDNERDFQFELASGQYDVVLSDYSLPSYNAHLALEHYREKGYEIPFIVVTGSLGEEKAVELMRLGASDYLIKDRLARLGSAVQSALESRRLREERRQALQRLRESEERLRRIAENAPDVIYRYRLFPEEGFDFVSPAIELVTGYTLEDYYADPQLISNLIYPDDMEIAAQLYENRTPMSGSVVFRMVRKDGAVIWTEHRYVPVFDESGQFVAFEGIARDITDRVAREQEREAIISVAAALRDRMTRAEIMPVVVEKTLDLVKAESAAISTFSEDDPTSMVFESAAGPWRKWQGRRLVVPPELVQRAFLAGELPVIEKVQELDVLRFAWLEGFHLVVCVPMRAQEEVLGLLWMGCMHSTLLSTGPEIPLKLLVVVADIAASALHRARLFDETRQRVQHLTALRTIDRAMSSTLDRPLMARVLLDQLTAQQGVDAADLILFDPYTHQLTITQMRGFHGGFREGATMRLSDSVAGRVVLDRHNLAIPDLEAYPESNSQKTGLLAEGLHSYLGIPLMVKGEVLGVLEILRRSNEPFEQDWLNFAEALVGQVSVALNNAELFDKLQRTTYDLIQAYDAVIQAWSMALESREMESSGHIRRVTWWTMALARSMGVPETELVHIRRGVMLHDVGKMAMPERLLQKPGPLSEEEWALVRKHPQYAFDWLSTVRYLLPALDIPYCHHECWDGSGYPRGLKGTQIPLSARIFTVIDVWDVLRSETPYRPAWNSEQALAYIREKSGSQFDPKVVEAFFDLLVANPADEEDDD